MRILYVTHEFPPHIIGGTGLYTWHVGRTLARTDEVFVFSRLTDAALPDYATHDESQDGMRVRYVNRPEPEWVPLHRSYEDERLRALFLDYLAEVRPDIVHFQHLYAMSVDLIEAAAEAGVPSVMTLHDFWAMCPMGQRLCFTDLTICRTIDTRKCGPCILGGAWPSVEAAVHAAEIGKHPDETWRPTPAESGAPGGPARPRAVLPPLRSPVKLARALGRLASAWSRYLFTPRDGSAPEGPLRDPFRIRQARVRRALEATRLLISPSGFLREEFINRFGIAPDRIIHSKNGMDVSAIRRHPKTPSARLRFGFVGGIMKAKGVHVLVDAFRRLAARRDDVELHVHGGASRWSLGYLDELRAAAAGSDRILFHGRFDNARVGEILGGIDVLVVPSIWFENAPLTLNEAAISGTAVITSDEGGMAEFVRSEAHGVTFRLGDSADLERRMAAFASDRSLLASTLAPAPRMKTIEENAAELRALYAGFAGSGSPMP